MANYFISPTGNNSNDGLSELTPWQTLSKITTGSFNPGDTIGLKDDSTFVESLTIPSSGTVGNPIQISRYGSGTNKPKITSFFTVPSWTSIGSGKYTYTSASFPTYLKTVKVNGNLQGKGRYPKASFLTISATSGASDFWVESSSLPAINYAGAEIAIRKQRFIYHVANIASVSGSRVYYGPDSFTGTYPAQVGYGFFIQNHTSTLTEVGDWMYDSSTKTITMYFGANDPNSYTVEIGTINNALSISNKSYLNINNLNITGFNNSGIMGNTVLNSVFNNLDVSFCGNDGILFSDFSSGNCTISDSTISNVHNTGLYANYNCSNMAVTGCSVTNAGLIIGGSGAYGNGDSKNLGICLQLGSNNAIENNYVYNIGFNGIVNNGDNSLVYRNYVDTFNTMKDDGGGIYYSLGGTGFSLSTAANITENIVVNGRGYALGTNDPSYVVYNIYMDDQQNLVNIEGNTSLYSRGGGLYIHNATDININNNLLAGSLRQFNFSEDSSLPINGITFTNNKVYCTSPEQIYGFAFSQTNNFINWGTFNTNDYRQVQNNIGMFEVYGNGTLPYNFGKSLTEWKAIVGGEAASTVNVYETYPPSDYTVVQTLFDKTYPTPASLIGGLATFSYLDNATSTFDDATDKLTKTGAGKRAGYMNFGQVLANTQYLLTANIFTESGTPQYISLNTESSYTNPYGLPKSKRLEIGASLTEYKMLIEGLNADASDQLLFLMESTFGNINITSLKLERLQTFTFEQKLHVLYNETDAPITFNLSYNAQPLPSGTIASSFEVNPFESLAIIQLEDLPTTSTTSTSSTSTSTSSTSTSSTSTSTSTSTTTVAPTTTTSTTGAHTTTTTSTTGTPTTTTTSTTLVPPTTTSTSTTIAPVTTTSTTSTLATTSTTSSTTIAPTTSTTSTSTTILPTTTSTSTTEAPVTTTSSTTALPITTTTTTTTRKKGYPSAPIKYKGPKLKNIGTEIGEFINSILKKINDLLT